LKQMIMMKVRVEYIKSLHKVKIELFFLVMIKSL